ncbi:MAG: DUF2284 domain-containing protein [Candidatus Omnitrophota bacterium]
MPVNKLAELCKKARAWGAEAKVIRVSTVKTGDWVRYKCQFGCSGYAESLTCPPYSPSSGETRGILDSYKKGVLIHLTNHSKKDISDIIVKLEKEAFFAGYYKAFALGAGPCRLCAKCNLKACRHPEEARPAMEACGIDVYATARNNGFKIHTIDSCRSPANYFALLLVE